MIFDELKKIVDTEKQKGTRELYIRNMLKEYMQMYVLNCIFTHSPYNKNLIFTGGSCLKHIFGLARLSEDLDFDYIQDFDVSTLKEDVHNYFFKKYQYKDIIISIKQRDRRLECKFPILKQLGLAQSNESDLLLVKVELSKIPTTAYTTALTPQNKFGFNFLAHHYDLASLFAGKLNAVLTRQRFTGKENRKTIKGRDFYDLIWFLKKRVSPNLNKLSAQVGKEINLATLQNEIDKRVLDVTVHYLNDLESDLIPFISNPAVVALFVKRFKDEYEENKKYLFEETVELFVLCKNCQTEFSAGIKIAQNVLEGLTITNALHKCLHCGFQNRLEKKDYIVR